MASVPCAADQQYWTILNVVVLGECLPLLEDLVDLGIDGLALEQSRRGYDSNPVPMRQRIGNNLCLFGWNWELDFINDNRESITRTVEEQIHGAGADGAFVMTSTYLTAEANLEAIDHYCNEILRVSREKGY